MEGDAAVAGGVDVVAAGGHPEDQGVAAVAAAHPQRRARILEADRQLPVKKMFSGRILLVVIDPNTTISHKTSFGSNSANRNF